jgi:hypothetical protein
MPRSQAQPEPEWVKLEDVKCQDPNCRANREGKHHAHGQALHQASMNGPRRSHPTAS